MTQSDSKKNNYKLFLSKAKDQRVLILMVLPAFAVYLLCSYIPLMGWSLAFFRYRPGIQLFQNEFIGLKYFIDFFSDTKAAGYLFRNTLCINLISLAAIFLVSIIFSIILREVPIRKLSRSVQMVSLFPFFLSWIIAYSLIYALFGLESGAVNYMLVSLGVIREGIDVLGRPDMAWPLMITLNVWKNMGYYSIIFLSTIVAIPVEEYEAAYIDGAGRLQTIWYITLKNLKQVFFVMLILQSGTIFNSSLEQFFAFTNSQNWDKMITFDMYVYKFGLGRGDYSYGTAVGIVKTLISIILLYTVNGLSKKYAEQSVL
jgi:putative aldouronate transport system permease protein